MTLRQSRYGANRKTADGIDVTGNATHVHIASASSIPPTLTENVYSGTTVGDTITEGGLDDYTFWEFHVEGVDADDDVSISISLDGVNFIKPGLVDVMNGAHIDQSVANIETDGVYVFGTVADQASRAALSIKSLKVTRETATGANQVDVTARAH